jgi:hypothetical protein
MIQNEALGLPPGFDESQVPNILLDAGRGALFDDNPVLEILDVMSNPAYFYYTCKWLFNIHLMPFQVAILQELWTRKFPMLLATRGGGKTWILSLYAMLRAIFHQGAKVVVVGAAFRQSKLLFEYMEQFWRAAPILRNMVGDGKHQGPKRDVDRCNFYIGQSEIIAIPLGDGTKIRGLRANYTIADEFASIPLEIFEVVIKGFASVSASPDKRVEDMARIKVLRSLGMYSEADDVDLGFGNQTIVSGTAYYAFNHLYDYWLRYKQIIESGGDQHKLEEIFRGEVPEGFDWKQFGIFRVPWQKLPFGFMDETQVHQARATVHSAIYQMEYGACFARDSEGFFKRSLIESCVCKDPIELPSGSVQFSAVTRGNPNHEYIYGIDPASEQDNFAIVILEKHEDHSRIVYSWSINRQELRERIKKSGQVKQKSFYTYCAQKIRDLMRLFPTQHIGIDAQGGGIAIMEALHDCDEYDGSKGERPLWPWIKQGDNDVFWWEKPDKPTDGEPGLHILHMVQFAQADFTRDANHFMRKDFESKITLFPQFDPATIDEAISLDKINKREHDTLEDCVMEIEELKDELATIIHDQTTGGRDRWDTPEVKLPGNKKGRLRKDRYSALLIANMIVHMMENKLPPIQHEFVGGYVGQRGSSGGSTQMYVGPDHVVSKMNQGVYGKAVGRRGFGV